MEVASGIAGLISLSITACNGLVSYYQSWSSQDEAIAALQQSLTDSHRILRLFHKPLARISAEQIEPEAVEHINKLRQCLKTNLEKLDAVLTRCHANRAPRDVHERIVLMRKKALYPFKKQTVRELAQVTNDIRANLSLCIVALQLDIDVKLLEQHEDLLDVLKSVKLQASQNETRVQSIHTVTQSSNRMTGQLHSQLTDMRSDFQDAKSILSDLSQQGARVSATLSTMSQQVSAQSITQTRDLRELTVIIQRGFGELRRALEASKVASESQSTLLKHMAGAVTYKPYLHRELCAMTFDGMMQVSKRTEYRRLKGQWSKDFGIAKLIREEKVAGAHSRDHSHFTPRATHTSYRIRIGYWRMFLKKTIEAVFTWQRGSGGSSISAGLNVRAFMNPSSPALCLLQKHHFNAGLGLRLPPSPKEVVAQLKRFYRDGQASPLDVDCNGSNALFACFCIMRSLDGESAVEWMHSVVSDLIDAGVLWSEPDVFGRYPLGFYYDHCGKNLTVVEHAVSLGADSLWTNSSHEYRLGYVGGSDIYCTFPGVFDSLLPGPLCEAVIARSEEKVTAAFLRWPNALEERVSHGLHALHLAADWPEGIQHLLSYGASSLINLTDDWGASAFDYASDVSNAESMTLLLSAGCLAIDERRMMWSWNEETIMVKMQALKARRYALCNLAQVYLLPDLFFIPLDRVLDEGANTVVCSLRQGRITIPQWLSNGSRLRTEDRGINSLDFMMSVYHHPALTAEAAEALWYESFHDIGVADELGRTPLTKHCERGNLRMVDWLISRGAEFPTCCSDQCPIKPPSFSTTSSHYIAFGLSRAITAGFRGYTHRGQAQRANNIEKILQDQKCLDHALEALRSRSQDDCNCVCSSSGCTPLLICLTKHRSHRDDLTVCLKRRLLRNIASQRPLEVIRLATFEVFRLTHTCCNVVEGCPRVHPRIMGEEVEEIQDEERQLILKFHDVITELGGLFQQLQISLSVFFHFYWKETVLQALSNPITSDRNALNGMKNVGVENIRETDDSEEEDAEEEEDWCTYFKVPTTRQRANYWLKFFDTTIE